MDETAKRLRETAEVCHSSYGAWHQDKKNVSARETLIEAIHELRKVTSRLEIELAISERDEAAKKPIPIPPHRDAQRRVRAENDTAGNESEEGQRGAFGGATQRRRRPHQGGPQQQAPDNAGNQNGNNG